MANLLSIIIPVFNSEKYLHRCINSVVAQDYKDFEIVLVDDGSTDGSGNICDEYAVADGRIHVVHQENAGQWAARFAGLENSKGDCIAFVDSDDWVEPYIFAPFMSRMAKEPDTDICVGTMTREYSDGRSEKVLEKMLPCHMKQNEAVEAMISCRYFRWEMVSKVYRRRLFAGIVPMKGAFVMEDFLWNWDLFHRSSCVYYEGNEAYRYFFNPESITNTPSKARRNVSSLNVLESMLKSPPYFMGPNARKMLDAHLDDIVDWIVWRLIQGNSPRKTWHDIRSRIDDILDMTTLVPVGYVEKKLQQVFNDTLDIRRQIIEYTFLKGSKLYLYGAGKLAYLAAAVAHNEGIKVLGCIISDDQLKKVETVCGLPVYFLSEVPSHDEVVIILTSAGAYDSEIMPQLENHGFRRVVALTGWRERLVKRR